MLHWQFLIPALCFNSQADGSWNFTLIEGEKLSARALFPPLSSWCIKRKAVPLKIENFFSLGGGSPLFIFAQFQALPKGRKSGGGLFCFTSKVVLEGQKSNMSFFGPFSSLLTFCNHQCSLRRNRKNSLEIPLANISRPRKYFFCYGMLAKPPVFGQKSTRRIHLFGHTNDWKKDGSWMNHAFDFGSRSEGG